MASYEAVIGLEVHVRLATKSKLFCSCPNRFGDAPNANVCEVCAGMPGTLPVPNAQAVHYATLVGLATNCKIRQRSIFARKNYFYPDLPAGYQISQFELPLCEHGYLDLLLNGQTRHIGITRIHMENDAGKNIHSKEDNVSYVDLNRAGSPLVEIVSEPDLRSASEAVAYLKTLYGIVVYLGVCDGNMEEGSFRCDVNVSMRPVGTQKLGVRAELKNLNSFRNVQRAIEYELVRQQDLLEDGETVVQETRLFDADKNLTMSMREKEEAHDYRYFPDPDLLPIIISDAELEQCQQELPELPTKRMQRFIKMTGLPEAEAEILVQTKTLADFFETAASKANPRKVANLILGSVLRECKAQGLSATDPTQWAITPDTLVELVQIVEEGLISTKIADDIFSAIFAGGQSPRQYVQDQGLVQISDSSSLEAVVDEILAKNPNEVQAYKSGKTKLISFFVGQVMRVTKGKANPALVNKLLNAKLVQ